MLRIHVEVRGRVQGVGYRWFVRSRAEELRLSGWVRNRPDGSVEAEAEGDAEALARFVEALRLGPPGARVEHVSERHESGQARHEGFHIQA